MTTEELLTTINNYFILQKQEAFSRFEMEGRQQEMWVTGQLICLFDSLLDSGELFDWEPQFPLYKALPQQIGEKRTQQKIDFMIRINQASDPIYLEVKAVKWFRKGQKDFNFALFHKNYLLDDVEKLAKIKKGRCFCLVFLYPSPQSDLKNWNERLGRFIERMGNKFHIQVNERHFAKEEYSEQLYMAKLEVS